MNAGDRSTGRDPDPTPEVWADMRRQWACGRAVRVEDYLADPSLPAGDPDFVLDLVYAEFALREGGGEAPPAAEYAARFPHLADRITRQLELHAALSAAATTADTSRTETFTGTPWVAQPADDLPERVGKYRVVARLGAGGQGTVYRGVHPTLGQDVVVKVSHRRVAAESPEGQRLADEGRLLAGLNHPNLPRVYDFDLADGRPFLATEYVPGRSLEQAARHDRPPPLEAARVVARLARALAHAHARGVVHLDLKPANVLVGDDGEPRLIDFGLGRLRPAWEERPDDTTDVSGTLAYMPPERAVGAPGQSLERADVFGLGGILYFLITGHPPFRGSTAPEVWARVRAGEWDRAALERVNTSRRLRDICRRCLAADPDARYGSAAAVAVALDRVAARPRVARRAAAGVAAAVLGLCGVGLAGWATPSVPTTTPTRPSNVGPAPVPASLRLRVWEGERYRDLVYCLPLRAGDEVRAEGERPAGFHAALLWADTDGAVHELSTVRPEDRGTAWRYPAEGKAVPLRGRAGTEVVLLCARRDRPVDVSVVKTALTGVRSWPALPESSVLRLTRDGVAVEVTGRGLGAVLDRADPEGEVRRRLDDVRQALAAECEVLVGLAVSHE